MEPLCGLVSTCNPLLQPFEQVHNAHCATAQVTTRCRQIVLVAAAGNAARAAQTREVYVLFVQERITNAATAERIAARGTHRRACCDNHASDAVSGKLHNAGETGAEHTSNNKAN